MCFAPVQQRETHDEVTMEEGFAECSDLFSQHTLCVCVCAHTQNTHTHTHTHTRCHLPSPYGGLCIPLVARLCLLWPIARRVAQGSTGCDVVRWVGLEQATLPNMYDQAGHKLGEWLFVAG